MKTNQLMLSRKIIAVWDPHKAHKYFLTTSSFYSHLPAYEDGTEYSETSAYKLQTPGNYPKESIQPKHINTPWGRKENFLSVQPGGTYGNQLALKGHRSLTQYTSPACPMTLVKNEPKTCYIRGKTKYEGIDDISVILRWIAARQSHTALSSQLC
jgi:hypothetical protein